MTKTICQTCGGKHLTSNGDGYVLCPACGGEGFLTEGPIPIKWPNEIAFMEDMKARQQRKDLWQTYRPTYEYPYPPYSPPRSTPPCLDGELPVWFYVFCLMEGVLALIWVTYVFMKILEVM